MKPGFGCLLLLAAAFASPTAEASGPVIEHKDVGCVVAHRFPRLEATIGPVESVAKARVYFRAEGTSRWYFVEMTGQAEAYSAALPKPKPTLTRLEYYIDATGKSLETSRTAEYRATVVGSSAACQPGLQLAASLAQATIAVGSVSSAAGAAALPVGFASEGVVSAAGTATASAGGVSGKALALGGAAVAGAGVAVAASQGGERAVASPAPTPTTQPPATQPPAPARPQTSFRFLGSNPPPGSAVQDPGGTFTLDLTLSVGVSCSEALASARVFVTLRRGGTPCVTSYRDLSLPAGSERNVDVSGFVVQAPCRPVPFTADDVWVRLYDLAGNPTTPLGEAILAVSYRIN